MVDAKVEGCAVLVRLVLGSGRQEKRGEQVDEAEDGIGHGQGDQSEPDGAFQGLTERSRPSIECWRRRRVSTTRLSALPMTPNRQTAGLRTSVTSRETPCGDDDDDDNDVFPSRAFARSANST